MLKESRHVCPTSKNDVLEIRSNVLGKNHPDYAITLNNLGLLYIATGLKNEAISFMSNVIGIHDYMLRDIFSISSEKQRMAFMKIMGNDLHYFLSLVLRYFSDSSDAISLAFNLVISRKAIGAEISPSSAANQHSYEYYYSEDIRSKIRELNSLRNQICMRTLSGPDLNETLNSYNLRLTELNIRKEELEAQISRYVHIDLLREKLTLANRKAIIDALIKYPEAALIEFVRFDEFDFLAIPSRAESKWKQAHYLAFVLLGNQTDNVHMVDLGEADPIDKMIGIFNDSLTGEEKIDIPIQELIKSRHLMPYTKTSVSISGLREIILNPLSSLIADRKRLFIASDGDLSRLSFEVLPVSDGRYLIDDYTISYLSTSRDITRFNQTVDVTKSSEPLVAADPDFDLTVRRFGIITMYSPSTTQETDRVKSRHSRELDDNTLSFQPLQGTNQEGSMVADLLGVKPYMKEKVLEEYIKNCLSPRILHIATHGFFLHNKTQDNITKGSNMEQRGPTNMNSMINRLSLRNLENPMLRSGLALAGANSWLQANSLPIEAEDGILTAEDVSMMDLSYTELVVLSACETGLGDVLVGEGVFGLRRAFILAGAQTLIMSLWKVSDKETKDLMVDFYNRLLSGKPRAQALREAQLVMKEKYPDPYYWGAFICQGNPGPTRQNL